MPLPSRQGDESDSLKSLQHRHLDEMWELELAEEAHERTHEGEEGVSGRLQHCLDALRRHYDRRTPQDLLAGNLTTDAQYLRHRYDRLATRVRRMISPGGPRHEAALTRAHHVTAWRVHLKSACDAHDEFAAEAREVIRYWTWVRGHQRLPGRLYFRLNVYNSRRIAHPWTSISEPVMETLAQLDAEINQHSARFTGGERPSI